MSLTDGPLFASGIYLALLLLPGYAIVCALLGKAGNEDSPTLPKSSAWKRLRNWSGLTYGFAVDPHVGRASARHGSTWRAEGRPTRRSSEDRESNPNVSRDTRLRPVRHWAELFGLSFTAGSGAMSLLLFVASLAGLVPSRTLLAVIAAASVFAVIAMARRHQLLLPSVPTPRGRIDPLSCLGVIAAATVIAATFNVQARSAWPGLGDIDAFAIWMFKAKWVTLAPLRPMPPAFHDPGLSYSHQDYPLGLPFLIAGAYALAGGISEPLAKMLLLPQYLALVAVGYSALRRMHRRAIAVAVTAIFAAAPVLTKNAGLMVAETPLILAFTAALAMLLSWMETGSRGELMLAGFFAAVAAFTKNEGLALLPVIGGTSLLYALTHPPAAENKGDIPIKPERKIGMSPLSLEFGDSENIRENDASADKGDIPIKRAWKIGMSPLFSAPLFSAPLFSGWCFAGAVALGVITPWLIFRAFLPRTHEDYGGKLRNLDVLTHNLPRVGDIIPYLLVQMGSMQNAGVIWYVLAITAVLGWREFRHPSTLILWTILSLQLSLYAATFVVTPWSLNTLLAMITPKLLTQTTPVAALLIGLHLRACCKQPGL